MQKTNKRTFLLIASILLGLFRIMPIFMGYFGVPGDLAVFILAILSLFPMKTNTLENMLGTLILVVAFLILNTFTRNDSLVIDIINIARNAFIMVFAVYLCTEDSIDKELIRKIFWATLIAVTITQITSIIVVQEYPLAARLAIHGDREAVTDVYAGINVARMNLSGYDIAYILPMISALLYAIMRCKKIKPIFFILHVCISLWFLISVQFTLAILLYITILITLLISNGNLGRMIISVIAFLILFSVFKSLISQFFDYLSTVTESQVLKERFLEIESFLSGRNIEGSDLSQRLTKYATSWQTFLKAPLFGSILVPGQGGGHSAILDYISKVGIFGLTFLILSFRSVYKKTILKYKGIPYFECVVLSQISFFIFAFLNPAFRPLAFWVLFIATIGACEIIRKDNDNLTQEPQPTQSDLFKQYYNRKRII